MSVNVYINATLSANNKNPSTPYERKNLVSVAALSPSTYLKATIDANMNI